MVNNHSIINNSAYAIHEDGECAVYQMKNETGEGTMIRYTVFTGIYLTYNDFHMQNCHSDFEANEDMLCIDHCNEGRMEWNVGNGAYLYVKEGDLKIDTRNSHKGNFEFPLSHYHGITVTLYFKEAIKSLSTVLGDFPVDLYRLKEKFCGTEESFMIRTQESIAHIFSELYAVPSKIKKYYFKIKVLELLLYLSALEISDEKTGHPYFYKTQVEKIKAIEKLMTKDLEKRYTLNELSVKFDISLTSMKTCFKGVYGTSIYAYIRAYRMNRAAVMLRKSKDSIAYIAGCVGYESPSKFAAAFKSVMGKTPLEYRKFIV